MVLGGSKGGRWLGEVQGQVHGVRHRGVRGREHETSADVAALRPLPGSTSSLKAGGYREAARAWKACSFWHGRVAGCMVGTA